MKKAYILILLVGTLACGKTQKSTEKSPEEELVIADSISQAIEAERVELSGKTNETLTEVDSLLNSL